MAGRGRRGPPRRGRGPPRQDNFQEAEELGSNTLELDGKKITVELKRNDQGKFVKIIETQVHVRGRIILSSNKALELRSILSEFVAEYERLPPAEETTESERIKTENFSQGRRRYYVDLRQNQRGRFLKITMLAGNKTFVAIPGESLIEFRDMLKDLLKDCVEGEESGGGVSGDRPPPQPRSREPREPREQREPREPREQREQREPREQRSPPQSAEKVLPSKEVRAGGKRFYFDVEQNDRGTFIKLSEVQNTGRRNRINIPQSCWSKMSDAFASYAKDMPYASAEEDSTGSGSEDN